MPKKAAKPAAKKAAKKGSPMAANEGYCVKCKAKRVMANVKEVKMANGRPALKGTCPVCGTGMFKILPPS
ncbi:MAG TPA: DUF5679 domain-containing protein [Gemmatimonadales bacterium]|nr:DUF5679 domain-containing protein [Gemmatimonadales bacterium]